MQYKKMTAKGRFVIVIVAVFLTSCHYFNSLKNDRSLARQIEKEIELKNGEVDLSQFDSFDWDKLLILGPYTMIEPVEKELNLNLKNIRNNGIEISDYYNLIVFLKNNKSIKIVEYEKYFSPVMTIMDKKKCHFKLDNKGVLALKE